MKAGLTLLGALTIMWLQVIPAEAAQLMHIRIGEHGTFTRIVFEFDGHVRFQEPVIKGKGRFSIVFFDSATTEDIPFQKFHERTKRVGAVEFIQQGPHLTASVTLSSSDFKLNFFSLFSPDRVVLDIYWGNEDQTAFTPRKPFDRILTAPEAESKSLPPASKSGLLQISLLIASVMLNVITVIILALLSFKLLQRIRSTDPANTGEIFDSDETLDERVFSIDSKINEEMKKYDRT
jgi:hypothetical protein